MGRPAEEKKNKDLKEALARGENSEVKNGDAKAEGTAGAKDAAAVSAKVLQAAGTQKQPVEGQVITAVVTDIRRNLIEVELEDGQRFTARTASAVDYEIGQKASFIFNGVDEDRNQILLKNMPPQTDKLTELVNKVLLGAGITKTEKTETIVRELMAGKQSLAPANIRHFMSLSAKHPEASVKTMIKLEEVGIKVTDELAKGLEEYTINGKVFAKDLETVLNEVAGRLDKMPEGAEKEGLVAQLKEGLALISSNSGSPEAANGNVENAVNAANTENAETLVKPDNTGNTGNTGNTETLVKPDITENAESAENAGNTAAVEKSDNTDNILTAKTPEKPVQENAESAVNPKNADTAGLKPAEASTGVLKSTDPKEIVEGLKRELILNTKVLAEEKQEKKLLDNKKLLDSILDIIKKTESNSPAEKESAARAEVLRNENNLAKTFSDVFPFFRIPVRLKEELTSGELYVYKRKKGGNEASGTKAFLHFDLENLGSLDIYITLAGKYVSAKFTSDMKDSAEILREEMPSLESQLSKAGYELKSEVVYEEKEENKTPLDNFLDSVSGSEVSRFTFDIRA